MDKLPRPVLYDILLWLDTDKLIRTSTTSRHANIILMDPVFQTHWLRIHMPALIKYASKVETRLDFISLIRAGVGRTGKDVEDIHEYIYIRQVQQRLEQILDEYLVHRDYYMHDGLTRQQVTRLDIPYDQDLGYEVIVGKDGTVEIFIVDNSGDMDDTLSIKEDPGVVLYLLTPSGKDPLEYWGNDIESGGHEKYQD